jgi:cyclophilin family peptidyl-prolyl cis-trans isomerase
MPRQLQFRLAAGVVLLGSVLFLSGCGASAKDAPAAAINASSGGTDPSSGTSAPVTEPVQISAGAATTQTPATTKKGDDPFPEVVITTGQGSIRVRLNAEKAPVTVHNFLRQYVDRKFYDKTVFHYVDKGYMIAAGGFTSDLKPKPTRACILNEAKNGLQNRRGTVAMARLPDYVDSAASQFFINLVDNPSLDHADDEKAESYGYCVFGQVVEGMDVVDRIADVQVADKGEFLKTPVEAVVIDSIARVGR